MRRLWAGLVGWKRQLGTGEIAQAERPGMRSGPSGGETAALMEHPQGAVEELLALHPSPGQTPEAGPGDVNQLGSWASMKSLRRRYPNDPGALQGEGGRNADVDVRGQRRSNDTHFSTTDPESRMARKGLGKETRLCFSGHVLMENRHGLAVNVELTTATGTNERDAALVMLRRMRHHRCTLGADKGDDVTAFVRDCQDLRVTPHVARRDSWWGNAQPTKLSTTPGYQVSRRRRKRAEEIFGWAKTVGGGRKLRYLGLERNRLWAELTAAAFRLVRMSDLVAVPT